MEPIANNQQGQNATSSPTDTLQPPSATGAQATMQLAATEVNRQLLDNNEALGPFLVYLGDEEYRVVRMEAIATVSPVFKAAVCGPWIEARSGVINLSYVKPAVWDIFQSWIEFNGRRVKDWAKLAPVEKSDDDLWTILNFRNPIKRHVAAHLVAYTAKNARRRVAYMLRDYVIQGQARARMDLLVDLYLLADYMLAKEVQNATMNEILDSIRVPKPPAYDLEMIVRHTPPGSQLRRVFLDLARITEEGLTRAVESGVFSQETQDALASRAMEDRVWLWEVDRLCYHFHPELNGSGSGKCKCDGNWSASWSDWHFSKFDYSNHEW